MTLQCSGNPKPGLCPRGQHQGGEVPHRGIKCALGRQQPPAEQQQSWFTRTCCLPSSPARLSSSQLSQQISCHLAFCLLSAGEKKKYFCSASGKCQKWCNLWCASVFLCILKLRTNAKSSALDCGGFWFTYIKILLWFPIIYFCKQNWILVTKLSASPAVKRQKPECTSQQSKEFETRSWSTLSDLRLSSALPFWNILIGSEVNSSLWIVNSYLYLNFGNWHILLSQFE